MTKGAKIGLAVLLLVLIGWIYASPYIAFHRMQAAAERRDAVALADYVNFPALRESVKASLTVQMTKSMSSSSSTDNPFAGLGLLLAQTMVDRFVDALVTPEALAAMMQGAPPSGPERSTPPSTERTASKAAEKPITKFGYETFGRFTLRFASRDKPTDELVLVLLRDGLSWKLSAIRIPQL